MLRTNGMMEKKNKIEGWNQWDANTERWKNP